MSKVSPNYSESQAFFRTLARKEHLLDGQVALRSLMEDLLGASLFCAPLPARLLVLEALYGYQHFGFCVFGPAGRTLLTARLARMTGLAAEDIGQWLESVCYRLLEDFNVLRLADGEPSWILVDEAFFRDLSKRIICAEKGEDLDLGLSCWDDAWRSTLDDLARRCLEFAEPGALHRIRPILAEAMRRLPGGALSENQCGLLCSAMEHCLTEIAENPLRLLVWRVECFTPFASAHGEARFFVRENTSVSEQRASRIAAILALFLPHRCERGGFLLPESPLTPEHIVRLFAPPGAGGAGGFDLSLLRHWLGPRLESDPTGYVNELLGETRELGLLFAVPVGRFRQGFGLTKAALSILQPFHAALTAALVGSPPSVAAKSQGQSEGRPAEGYSRSAEDLGRSTRSAL